MLDYIGIFHKIRNAASLEFTRLTALHRTGDERIELPLRVLETPVIPFDQSPILNSVQDAKKHPFRCIPVPSKPHISPHSILLSYPPSLVMPRPISNSQLHVLPHFHLCPIYLVVFKGLTAFAWDISS